MELKRQFWVCADAGGFGRSSSESDVELLTKKGLEEFLLQTPQSPLSRNSSTRRSRLSLGITADRELQMYLEAPQDDQLNKCNSLPRTHTRQSRPTIAWMNSKDNHEQDNTHLNKNKSIQGSLPLPTLLISSEENDHTAVTNKHYMQANIDSNNNQPQNCQEKEGGSLNKTPLSPLAVTIQERELVKKLHKFDLQGTVHDKTEDVCITDLESSEDLHHSLRHTNGLIPSKYTKNTIPSNYDEDIEMTEGYSNSSSTPVSPNTCTSEKPEHGSIFCVDDTTESSLSLDCSEAQNVNYNKGDTSVAMETKRKMVDVSVSNQQKDVDCSLGDAGSTKENTIKCQDQIKPNSVKESFTKTNTTRSNNTATTKPVRMLNASEHETMRKVVSISKTTKSGSIKRTELRSSLRDEGKSEELKQTFRHSLRAKNDNVPRTSPVTSPTTEEPKLQRGSSFIANSSRFQRDQLQRKGSVRKPAAKPVRNIAKPKPEETKICRTSPKEPNSPDTSKLQPSTPTPIPKPLPSTPSFARNTVASSSRRTKPEQSPSTPTKTLTITRSPSIYQSKGKPEPLSSPKENGKVNGFKRTSSIRTSGKGIDAVRNGTSEVVQKDTGIVEKSSGKLKDTSKATLGKILKPLLK